MSTRVQSLKSVTVNASKFSNPSVTTASASGEAGSLHESSILPLELITALRSVIPGNSGAGTMVVEELGK